MSKAARHHRRQRVVRGLREAARPGISTRSAAATATPDAAEDLGHRDLTSRTFSVRSATFSEADRTVEAVLTTEAPVLVYDWATDRTVREILLMAGCRLPATRQIPLLDAHGRWSVSQQLGSTRGLHTEGGSLLGRNQFADTHAAAEAMNLVRDGHLTDNSVGYRVHASTTVEPGETLVIAGRTFTAPAGEPLRITTDWEPVENSPCSIGADDAAKMRAATAATADKNRPAPLDRSGTEAGSHRKDREMEFTAWLTERGIDPATLSEAQTTALRALHTEKGDDATRADATDVIVRSMAPPAPAPVPKTPKTPPAPPAEDASRAAADAAAIAARQRIVDRVRQIDELAEMSAVPDNVRRQFTEAANPDVEAARAAFLTRMRADRAHVPHASFGIHSHDRSATGDQLAAALAIRSSQMDHDELVEGFGEQNLTVADRFRDLNCVDLCRHAISLDGRDVPSGRDETLRAAVSGQSLPYVLGAVVNKFLMRGYGQPKATWRKWCSVRSVPDFKANTAVRYTATGQLEVVNNNGKIPADTGTEEYETLQADTYAKIMAVTRQNLINDDLGVFTAIPNRHGVAASQTISRKVYTVLLANAAMADSVALFHATHLNLNPSSALTPATYAAAIAAFLGQKDKAGEPIDVMPAICLVPPGLGEKARSIQEGKVLVLTGTSDNARMAKFADAGMLEAVVEHRLASTGYTGYSATSWYVMGAPGECDNMIVAFVNGRQNPIIERVDMGPDVLAIG
ncbi:MAG TPA: hypothetical protein VMW52_00085, partial [Phycisphaerae bacterium]|nr:hypothetical protein [Phycisphaerae bacterium]